MPQELAGFRGLDRGESALQVLSDFWQVWFKDRVVLRDYINAANFDIAQGYFDLMEGVLATSIQDIPVFHKEKWYSLVLAQEFMEFDVESGYYRHPKPVSMHSTGTTMYNRIYRPSQSFVANTDYYGDGIYIYFKENPLDNSNLATAYARAPDNSRLKRVSLWCLNSLWDEDLVYEYYGYLLDLPGVSSEVYRALVQGVWKLYTNGATIRNVESAANVILGIPVARTQGEVVRHIDSDAETLEQIIITTSNIYRVPQNAPLATAVVIGGSLALYQPLTRIVKIEDHLINPSWPTEQGATEAILSLLGIPPESVIVTGNNGVLPEEVVTELDPVIIGSFFISDEPEIFIGGQVVTTSTGTVVVDANGGIIINISAEPDIESINIGYLSFNTFHLKVEGNVGGRYLETQNQIREILKPGLPAYVDYVFRVAARLTDSYDLGNLAYDVVTSRLKVYPEDSYNSGLMILDSAEPVRQALIRLLSDTYLPPWNIGEAKIGEGRVIGNGPGVVDRVAHGGREYPDYQYPVDSVDVPDEAVGASVSYTELSDEYGDGVLPTVTIGDFVISSPGEIYIGGYDPDLLVIRDDISIRIRHTVIHEEYLGRPWAIGSVSIGEGLYIGSTGATDELLGFISTEVTEDYDQYVDMLDLTQDVNSPSILDTYDDYFDATTANVTYKLTDVAVDQTPILGVDLIIGSFSIGGAVLDNIGEFLIGEGYIGPVYGVSVDDSGVRRFVDLDGPGGLPPSELPPGGYNG